MQNFLKDRAPKAPEATLRSPEDRIMGIGEVLAALLAPSTAKPRTRRRVVYIYKVRLKQNWHVIST